jgi:HEAT repeat protein
MALVRRTSPAPAEPAPDRSTLVAALADPDAERRRRAAVDLGGDSEAVPDLLARVPVEEDQVARDAVLTTLAAHDRADVAESLATHLRSDDAALRTAVVEALAAMPHGVLPLLPKLVVHPDHDVRILTAMVLADLPSPAAMPWLVEIVAADRHPNVVAAALDALLPAAAPEHAPLLERTRERFAGDPFLCFTIDAALETLGASR